MTLVVITLLGVLLLASPARALIEFSLGNDPVQDGGWPAGSLAVANLESRVAVWSGPLGDAATRFAYRGDAAAFQEALDLFAKIEAPQRVLVVNEGPGELSFLKNDKDPKSDARYDWSFAATNVENHARLRKQTEVFPGAEDLRGGGSNPGAPPPPQMDVYVGGAPPGAGIDWSRVTVPDGVKVIDERASANGYPAGSGSVVRGSAVDLETSKPVPGARVVVTRYDREREVYEDVAKASAKADGTFELTGIPPGGFTVHVAADGYAPRALDHVTFGKDTFKQYPAARLARAAALSGTVKDGDGKPLRAIVVRADLPRSSDGRHYPMPAHVRATTDASGHFTLPGLPVGTCQIDAQAQGLHQVAPFEAHAVPGQTAAVTLAATGVVRGKVTQAGGAPTDGPYIVHLIPEGGERVGAWSGSMDLHADGSFEFTGVPPGKYTVTARPNPGPELKGKDPNERPIEVKPGAAAEVEIAVK